jgi:REP element-mobilizing transposase RayT
LAEPNFALLARAFNRARALHPFYLTAWVFPPDPARAGHCIGAPQNPVTISLAMKPVKQSSMIAVNQGRDTDRELWQPRFPSAGLRACFDRALRTVGEYNEKVEHIHLNPVRAGLVSRPEDWSRPAGSSYNEYAGMSAEEQERRCGLIVDRVRMPSDRRARIWSAHEDAEKTRTPDQIGVRATCFRGCFLRLPVGARGGPSIAGPVGRRPESPLRPCNRCGRPKASQHAS